MMTEQDRLTKWHKKHGLEAKPLGTGKRLKHGHAPEDLRQRFQEYADIFYSPFPPEESESEYYPEGMSTYDFYFTLGQLWHCTDGLPSSYCEQIEIPHGSTYAQAARKIKAALDEKHPAPTDEEIALYTQEAEDKATWERMSDEEKAEVKRSLSQ